jgi:bis(5'-nucleosidyl)-tetraphosphatase
MYSFTEHLSSLQYDVRGKPKTTVYLLAELIKHNTPVKLSDEHQCFKWVPLYEACQLVKHQSLQEVMKECSAFLHQSSKYSPLVL